MNHDARVAFLVESCNKYGDFKVARSTLHEGLHMWSRHRSVLECQHTEQGFAFLETVNHRQIWKHEVIIDLEEFDIARLRQIEMYLIKYKFEYIIYESGSRGHHVHCHKYELGLISRDLREKVRDKVIRTFNADPMKKSDLCMIALEKVPHWKTGNLKKEVVWDGTRYSERSD